MSKVRFDGVYCSSTANYTDYLRFYADCTVISVSTTGDLSETIEWFAKGHPSVYEGKFSISGNTISFEIGKVDHRGEIMDQSILFNTHSLINDRKFTLKYDFTKVNSYSAGESQAAPASTGKTLQDAVALYNAGRYTEAIPLFNAHAAGGNVFAMFYLGLSYEFGHGVEANAKMAFDWYYKAAEKGQPDAQHNIGLRYEYGVEGVNKDIGQALHWYTKAADQGIPESQVNLGRFYHYGMGVKENHTKAFELYTKAADQGHEMGIFNIGVCYLYGVGVKSNDKTALEWFKKAAEKGNTLAQEGIKKVEESKFNLLKTIDTAMTISDILKAVIGGI